MSIDVFGVLDCDAYAGRRRVNDAAVTIQVRVTSAGALFEAVVLLGERPEDHIRAAELAGLLRRGMPARISADDLAWCTDHGRARFIARTLLVVEVDGMQLLSP